MDNITHSLIGVVVGQAAAQTSLKDSKTPDSSRRLILWSSILGNNFPDLDVLYTSITPGPLGSLLHHRGHTHTFVGLIPQWLLILGLFWVCKKWLGFTEVSRRDWRQAGIVGALGLLLHIVADSWNSYGVHPFFPFWNGWIYGDAIFIVEPILWTILAASIFWSSRSWMKFIPLLLLAVLLGWGFHESFLKVSGLAFMLGVFVVLFLTFRKSRVHAASLATIFVAVFVLLNLGASGWIRRNFQGQAQPNEELLDVSLSPVPAQPLCWFVIRISITGEQYEVRRGLLSLWPNLVEPTECPNLGRVESELIDNENVGSLRVSWSEHHQTSLTAFERIKSDCHLRAWLRFARVPFVSGQGFTDLRFSRNRIRNFTDLLSQFGDECPPNIPPWIPPRMDLIRKVEADALF